MGRQPAEGKQRCGEWRKEERFQVRGSHWKGLSRDFNCRHDVRMTITATAMDY